MLVVLAGLPRVGKSALAQALAGRLDAAILDSSLRVTAVVGSRDQSAGIAWRAAGAALRSAGQRSGRGNHPLAADT